MNEPYPLFDPDYPQIRLLWDSTCLGDLQRDPYYYMMKRIKGFEGSAAPLEFGKIYHSALEARDRILIAGGTVSDATDAARLHAIEEAKKVDWAQFEDTYRTPFALQAAVLAYCQKWDPEDAIPYTFPNGKPAIEQDFCLPILLPSGEPLCSPSGRPYLLCGYFDGIRHWEGRVVGWERKHTIQSLDSYFRGFEDDNQVLTYGYALQCLFPDMGIRSVVVDACQLLKTKGNTYGRREFSFSRAQMEGHLQDVIQWIKFAEMCATTNWWPRKRNTWSPDKVWKGVLAEPPLMRESYARAKFGEPGEVWNPTRVRNA